MKNFNSLFEKLMLLENVSVLSHPSNNSYQESYEKINVFVNSTQSKPVSEVISSINLDKFKSLNMGKDQVDKVINLSKKRIPGLNNVTVEYLFYPNNLVANLYNAANNANSDFKSYELIVNAYNEYKNNPSTDKLASLIIAINTYDQPGKLASISRATINKMVNFIPGTSLVVTMLLGSIAQSSANLTPISVELNTVGNNIESVKNSGVLPGTILQDIVVDSVKSFSLLSVGTLAANIGDKTLDKAKELTDKGKEKAKELLNKTKEELSKLSDKDGKNFFDKIHNKRTPGSMSYPKVNLRGPVAATTPAKY